MSLFVMLMTHSRESCTTNLRKFIVQVDLYKIRVQVSWVYVISVSTIIAISHKAMRAGNNRQRHGSRKEASISAISLPVL